MIGVHIVPMLTRWIAWDADNPYPIVRQDAAKDADARGNVKTSNAEIKAHSQPLDFKKLEQTGYELGANERTLEWRWFWTFDKVETGDKVTFREKEFDVKNVQIWATHTEFQGVYST